MSSRVGVGRGRLPLEMIRIAGVGGSLATIPAQRQVRSRHRAVPIEGQESDFLLVSFLINTLLLGFPPLVFLAVNHLMHV